MSTDTIDPTPGATPLRRIVTALVAATKRLRERAATFRSIAERRFQAVIRLAHATRWFGLRSVTRAVLATPLFWLRRFALITAPVVRRWGPAVLKASGLMLLVGTGRRLLQLTRRRLATSGFRIWVTAATRRATGSRREWLRPAGALSAAAGSLLWVAFSPIASSALLALLVGGYLALCAVRPSATALVSTRHTEEVSGTSAVDELTKDELDEIYSAMLTLEAALPQALALLQIALEDQQPTAVAHATRLIRECETTVRHLAELHAELLTIHAGEEKKAPALADDIGSLLTRIQPQLNDCLALLEVAPHQAGTRKHAAASQQTRLRSQAAARSRSRSRNQKKANHR